jgi:polysaccharide biosynthesis/export protein
VTTYRASLVVRLASLVAVSLLCAGAAGCVSTRPDAGADLCDCDLPRELTKTTLPTYVIEPPDILYIDSVRLIPKPPYHIEPLDVLAIIVPNAPQTAPIAGMYTVEPDGTVNLGFTYGSVRLEGMTVAEAKKALEAFLAPNVVKPEVTVYPVQTRGTQQIRGEHLVRPDGTVGLGSYGNVPVAGKTLTEAKEAIEEHLTQFLEKPEVSVDVFAYNSKVYYVIFDGGGFGQQIVRLPVTGNDTVLDAVAQVNGLSAVADKRRIWVARPGPACSPCDQILPVDWNAVTKRGRVETNFQLLPGDRLYVAADPLVTLDTFLGRLYAPIERTFGITLLGNGLVQSLRSSNFFGGGGTGTGGFGGF